MEKEDKPRDRKESEYKKDTDGGVLEILEMYARGYVDSKYSDLTGVINFVVGLGILTTGLALHNYNKVWFDLAFTGALVAIGGCALPYVTSGANQED